MRLIAGLTLLLACAGCSRPPAKEAERPKVVAPMDGVEEGVYFFRNMFSTLVLELKGGRFRYWFSTDVKGGEEPAYPVTGLYEARGATVRLIPGEPHLEDEWTFRKLDGQTTLWRPHAVQLWDKGSFDYFGVLYRTDLDAEYVWRNQSVVNR